MKKGAKRNQIISELLHVTDEEFTDEELIHQLIATEVTKKRRQGRAHDVWAACRRRSGALCGQLGVYFQLYRRHGHLDGHKPRFGFESI
ncbi:hypothetical protein [Hominenteromicrobium sp.]|uniref:hypothetical protein n=1 Tax=Hominenteromicrobium sp. TaxID=3073581 RepID=UPI003999B738